MAKSKIVGYSYSAKLQSKRTTAWNFSGPIFEGSGKPSWQISDKERCVWSIKCHYPHKIRNMGNTLYHQSTHDTSNGCGMNDNSWKHEILKSLNSIKLSMGQHN